MTEALEQRERQQKAASKKRSRLSSVSKGRGWSVRTQKWMDWIMASAKSSPSQNFDVFSLQAMQKRVGF